VPHSDVRPQPPSASSGISCGGTNPCVHRSASINRPRTSALARDAKTLVPPQHAQALTVSKVAMWNIGPATNVTALSEYPCA